MKDRKQTAVIVFLTEQYNVPEKALFPLKEVLFKPIVDYRVDALTAAGYTNICVIDGIYGQNYEDHFANSSVVLGNSFGEGYPLLQTKRFLETHHFENVLVCWADFPVTPSLTLSEITSSVHANLASNEESFFYGTPEELLPHLDSTSIDLQEFEGAIAKQGCHATDENDSTPEIALPHFFLRLQAYYRQIKQRELLDSGIYLIDPNSVYIHPDAKIGKGTMIYPGTIIKSGVTVGDWSEIGPNTLLEKSTIGYHSTINSSQVYSSTIGNHVKIGPYCHIRPGSVIKDQVQIGDFVEVKNSTIDEETHISHLTYIGDSDLGKRINVGCGVVTVNYDGQNKYRTQIGDGAFIGCNTNLVSPVNIGNGAYTAAGSTITEDIPDDSLGIARNKQINKKNWAKGKYKKA